MRNSSVANNTIHKVSQYDTRDWCRYMTPLLIKPEGGKKKYQRHVRMYYLVSSYDDVGESETRDPQEMSPL
jgi:hypothetical protein